MKLRSLSTLIATIVIAFSLAGCKSSSKEEKAETSSGSDLRLKLKAGETYQLQTTVDQDITQELPQSPVLKFHQMLQIGLNCHVTSVDADGNYNLEVTYKSFAFKVTGLPEPIDFDSNSSKNTNFPLAGIVGKSYQMKLTPLGKVLSINGADQLIDSLVDNMTAPPEVKAVLSKEALKNQFGDQATQEMMNSLVGIYPDRPIKQGEHWQHEMTMKYGYPVKLNIEYTLVKANSNDATLDVKITRSSLENPPTINISNLSLSYQLAGEDTGTMNINLKTGWINSSDMKSKLAGKVIVAPSQELPEGLSWPITVEGTVALKGDGPVSQ